MTRILDFNGRDADRTVTVASIAALKGNGRQYVQVTAGDGGSSGCRRGRHQHGRVPGGSGARCSARLQQTVASAAAIKLGGEVTLDDLLATAFRSLSAGADTVITARRMDAVRLLAAEGVHDGTPRVRAEAIEPVRRCGTSGAAVEAAALWRQFQELERSVRTPWSAS